MNVSVLPTNGRPARFPFMTWIVIEPGVVPTAAVKPESVPFKLYVSRRSP